MANSRLAALVAAALDVMPAERTRLVPVADSSPEHRARFRAYVKELRSAKKSADKWWSDLIETETARIGDPEHAQLNVQTRRPPGAVVNPMVIDVIRSAWLDCQDLNDTTISHLHVAPVAFVGLWLEESGHDDLAEFVAALPFWPIGLSDSARWE